MSDKADFAALAGRTQMYALQVKRLFDEAVNELLDISKQVKSIDDDDMFTFDMKKSMEDKAQAALRKLHSAVYTATKRGIVLEWGRADKAADEFVSSTFGKQVLKDNRYSSMLLRHESAMNAFINRTENGMNLSDRVWKPVEQLRKEMELALTVSIGEGESASTIARRVKQYLNDPDKLFRRVRDEKGNLKLSKAAKAYHPGRGVYRSSYKNAMRLTRTETNMAYRNEDCNRVSDLDFVLGIRIQTSKNHPEDDICDELAGDYPKTFKWTGWHPQCRCYMTSILPTAEELRKYNKALLNGESYTLTGQVKGYPAAFKQWVNDHSEKIENGGSVPYFVSDNPQAIDRILGKQPTIAELAAERHAARTPEQEQAIRDAWAERNHKRELIKNGANNVYNVAKDWNEVDASELQKAIESGDYMQMKAASKAVAQAIVEMRNKENALSDLMPNAHELHKSYSLSELQDAYGELNGVMSKWLSKYGYASVDAAPLTHLRNKLDFELTSPTINYKNKDIVNSAIKEKITAINQKVQWNDLVSRADSLKTFKNKSSVYKNYLKNIDDAIKRNDFKSLQSNIAEAEKIQQIIISKRIKRGGDTKGALNSEYKGGAVGKDITAGVDTSKMKSEDPYRGTYTNNVARLQGFDSQAKLVSEQEFEILSKACGDVFYRTVNPTTFRGKKMTSKEFASQLYVADLLELNGPGGRVYGDGMYVATSAWNGNSTIPLSDRSKRIAYNDSLAYGGGYHTMSEMTWTRMPKIIKQTDLWKVWKKLSNEEQMRFDCNENTYACALGYDGMYCEGVNYMVIWNRSIIAVKNK